MKITKSFLWIGGLVLAAALTRLLPHPNNFSAIGAMALFGGAALSHRVLKYALPLAALFVSDMIINNFIYSPDKYGVFYDGMLWVYAAFVLIVFMGSFIKKIKPSSVLVGSLAASVVFFIISNFGTWMTWNLYPMTAEGLMACYIAAIPFFWNTLASTLLFSALLFGGFYLVEQRLPEVAAVKG